MKHAPTRIAITRFCFFFKTICSKEIKVDELQRLQEELCVTLCLLEKHFPPAFFDVMIHLTVHLTREVKLCGPILFRWMYPFERFMKVIKGHVRNRNRPEGCIAEGNVAEETIEFFSEFFKSMDTVGIPHDTHNTCGLHEDTISPIDGTPISAPKTGEVCPDLFEKAHFFVLQNTSEVEPYIMSVFVLSMLTYFFPGDTCNFCKTNTLLNNKIISSKSTLKRLLVGYGTRYIVFLCMRYIL